MAVVEFLEKLNREKRLIKGAYYSSEDDVANPCFCMVGGIGEFTRQLAQAPVEDWADKGFYDDHKRIASVYPIDIHSLYAMDVIFEASEKLTEQEFRDLALLSRNINWDLPAIYRSMVYTVYSELYVEAGLARGGFNKMPMLSWESWPEIRSDIARGVKKGFAHEFDYYMVETLLNPKDMEFQKILALYMKGNYSPVAQVIQKLKSHTTWDASGGTSEI